jgi:hypothetical protein
VGRSEQASTLINFHHALTSNSPVFPSGSRRNADGRLLVVDQRGGRPIKEFFMVPALLGLFAVGSVAVVYYFEGSCRISDCIEQVPYNNVAFALFFLAILVELLEKVWHRRRRRPPAS